MTDRISQPRESDGARQPSHSTQREVQGTSSRQDAGTSQPAPSDYSYGSAATPRQEQQAEHDDEYAFVPGHLRNREAFAKWMEEQNKVKQKEDEAKQKEGERKMQILRQMR